MDRTPISYPCFIPAIRLVHFMGSGNFRPYYQLVIARRKIRLLNIYESDLVKILDKLRFSMFIGGITGFASIPLFDLAVGPLNRSVFEITSLTLVLRDVK